MEYLRLDIYISINVHPNMATVQAYKLETK